MSRGRKGDSYIGGGTILRPEIDFAKDKKTSSIEDETTKLRAIQKNLAGMAEPMKASYLRGKGPKPNQPVILWAKDDKPELRQHAQIEEAAAGKSVRLKSKEARAKKERLKLKVALDRKHRLKMERRRQRRRQYQK
jgi:hypothetical protein